MSTLTNDNSTSLLSVAELMDNSDYAPSELEDDDNHSFISETTQTTTATSVLDACNSIESMTQGSSVCNDDIEEDF